MSLRPLPCLCASVRRATRAVTRLYDEMLRPAGLRTTQFTLLQVLDRNTWITPSRLGEQLAIDNTTLSRTLRLLARRGWIASRPGEDRRERRLALTAAGRRRLARGRPRWQRAQVHLRQRLGRREWEQVMGALTRVTSAAHPSAPSAPRRAPVA